MANTSVVQNVKPFAGNGSLGDLGPRVSEGAGFILHRSNAGRRRGVRRGIEKGRERVSVSRCFAVSKSGLKPAYCDLPGNWATFTFPRVSSAHSALGSFGNGRMSSSSAYRFRAVPNWREATSRQCGVSGIRGMACSGECESILAKRKVERSMKVVLVCRNGRNFYCSCVAEVEES